MQVRGQNMLPLATASSPILPAMNSSRVAATLPIFPKNYLSSWCLWLQRIAIFANRAAEAIGRESRLPAVKSGAHPGQLHVVWKSVESIGRLGVIARAIPDCRGIMILRHPCAYVASLIRGETQGQFTQSDARCEDYEIFAWLLAANRHNSYAPSLDALKKLQPVERMAWRWVLTNAKALADISDMENCRYVRYEAVCADPFALTWELFHFAGLSWHLQVAAFIKQSTMRHSDRYYSVFKDPAVAASKWQKELPAEIIERIMKIVDVTPLRGLYCYPDAANDGGATVPPMRQTALCLEYSGSGSV